MMKFLLPVLVALPGVALAAGTVTPNPPKPTETTTVCTDGMVWDIEVEQCVAPVDLSAAGKAALDAYKSSDARDQILLQAVREFAYAGQYNHAQDALREVSNQDHDLALTYWGFTERKLGRPDAAMVHYSRALAVNPDNLLARSYMGQAHVEAGDVAAAKVQLREINARGGRQTWPAISLKNAIRNGAGYAY